jgi:hypothetical protein
MKPLVCLALAAAAVHRFTLTESYRLEPSE